MEWTQPRCTLERNAYMEYTLTRYMPKFLRWITCKKKIEGGRIMSTVSSAMDLWRQGCTFLCYAPSLKPSGARCYPGKTLMSSCPNKIPNVWPTGGRMWRARYRSKNAKRLMGCLFTSCETYGRKGIGGFSKMNTKRQIRSPI
jgi:hypothetical protein